MKKSIVLIGSLSILFLSCVGKGISLNSDFFYSCSCQNVTTIQGVTDDFFEYDSRSMERNATLTVNLGIRDSCINYKLYFEELEDTLAKVDSIEGFDVFSSDSLRTFIENGKELSVKIENLCQHTFHELPLKCKKESKSHIIVRGH